MTKKHSIDGFISRRPGSRLGELHSNKVSEEAKDSENTAGRLVSSQEHGLSSRKGGRSDLGSVIPRSDIDDSLKEISDIDADKGKKRRKKRGPLTKKQKIIRWIIVSVVVILLAIGGWVVYKGLNATGNIFNGNIFDIIQNQPLKADANGRSNILVVGTSLDDPGHEAPYLTDSIMIVSIDQKNKDAYMISIPRDLEVEYGQACIPGYRGKINSYYNCVGGAQNNLEADRKALAKTADFIGNIVGLDIQYGVNVNYTVMRALVKAVGGVTVTIESRDPRGQLDSNFDWKCGEGDPKVSYEERLRRCPPSGHYIDYPNGPVKLDAEHALYLAQARGDRGPTYGFEQSNFDREKNQQKIAVGIRERAMSIGVLANFTRVSDILDALGNNLRTTFETSEVQTLVSLAKDINSKDIKSISLIDGGSPILNGNAQPVAGMFQYGDLQALIKKKLSTNPVVREEANVVVMNGSGVAGVAQAEADKLEKQGFIISAITNAPEGSYEAVEVYQIGSGKDGTKAKLESVYGVQVKTTKPPVTVAKGTHFVVIIGKDRLPIAG